MGVPLADWIATVQAHPLKFKFEGLDGFHESIQQAYANDDYQRQKMIDDQNTYLREQLDKVLDEGGEQECEELERYIDYLLGEILVSQLPPDVLKTVADWREHACLTSDDKSRELVQHLEAACGTGYADYHRDMFSSCDPQWEQEFMEEADSEWLFEQFPLEEVYTSAGGYGIPAEDVVFVCPSCNQEPHSLDTLNDMGGHFYCGLCGAEHLPDSQDGWDLTDPFNLYKFANTLGVKLYPFAQFDEVLSQADPDCPNEGHGVYFHGELVAYVERVNREVFEDNCAPDLIGWEGIPHEKGIYDVQIYGVTAKAYIWPNGIRMSGYIIADSDKDAVEFVKSQWEKEPQTI